MDTDTYVTEAEVTEWIGIVETNISVALGTTRMQLEHDLSVLKQELADVQAGKQVLRDNDSW